MIWNLIEKALGLGVIPPNWKQRIYQVLLALIVLIETWVDIPDEFTSEVFVAKLATIIAGLLALVLKLIRDRRN